MDLVNKLSMFLYGYSHSKRNMEQSIETGIANSYMIDNPALLEELNKDKVAQVGGLVAILSHPVLTYKFIKNCSNCK